MDHYERTVYILVFTALALATLSRFAEREADRGLDRPVRAVFSAAAARGPA